MNNSRSDSAPLRPRPPWKLMLVALVVSTIHRQIVGLEIVQNMEEGSAYTAFFVLREVFFWATMVVSWFGVYSWLRFFRLRFFKADAP